MRTCGSILCFLVIVGAMQVGPWAQDRPSVSVRPKSRSTEKNEQIVAGESVGKLRLGMHDTDLKSVFEWRPEADETYSHESPCKYKEIHWLDLSLDATGVFAYVRDGTVFEITAMSPRFLLSGTGLSYGASLPELVKLVPDGRLFRWTDSGSPANGGKDVFFWISVDRGVAFGLYYSSKLRTRRTESITVFRPGTKFQPEGCLQAPQTLIPAASIEK